MPDSTKDGTPALSELIDNSSFGTTAARNLRARTTPEVAQQITDRVHTSVGRTGGRTGAEVPGEWSTVAAGSGLQTTAPERSMLARERLSRELRRLRTEAKMTGTATARATGMSQSKLSKIENGMLLPSVTDVERLVAELSAVRETRVELVELARSLHAEAETRRVVLHRGAHRHQQTISRVEARAATSRFFQLNLVPALLQSEPYLRTVLGKMPPSEQEAATAALRVRRSRMDDLAKQFVFLLSEAALRWRMGSAELMAEQVEHLAAIQRRPNVRLGVIPWSADTNVVALHGFHIYDERVVTVSVLTGNATITDPLDVREYLALFGRLERLAVRGEELQALLKKIASDHRTLG